MERRPLITLLAICLVAAAPATAGATAVDQLMAETQSQTLSPTPPTDGLTAQSPTESLSETPPSVGSSGSKSTAATPAATAALPYTGSDPRITLMLGLAALLAGAGLRLRTGDARDF